MFLDRLCGVLTRDDMNWRANTVVTLDNASYHKSALVKHTFERLGIKVIFTAPYSYESTPMELWFS
jgi:transposase